ncbi:MAG: type II toxin-antitoxin system PemK/MazF family toxin [Planctomycetes bacterium]|nr:type II toxin-antitoxin system PemK/MazF family toxin [Planctomycetota bacterium]
MSSRKPGDVVLVEVPFTDLSQSKKRPAIVLLSRGQDHLVAFFTSRVEQAGPDDVLVAASADNGLAVDSAALVTKLFTLHGSLIVRTLGHLSKSEHRAIVGRLVNLLRSTVDA